MVFADTLLLHERNLLLYQASYYVRCLPQQFLNILGGISWKFGCESLKVFWNPMCQTEWCRLVELLIADSGGYIATVIVKSGCLRNM